MATNKIAIRRDTAANWTAANPTLVAGEFGLETDTGYLKNGDGATAWTSLAYASYGLNSSGNIAMPAGKGIDFSAVAGGGATSSVLDDYEEGTWSSTLILTNCSSVTLSDARYIKTGNQCLLTGVFSGAMTTTGVELLIGFSPPFPMGLNDHSDIGVVFHTLTNRGNGAIADLSGANNTQLAMIIRASEVTATSGAAFMAQFSISYITA